MKAIGTKYNMRYKEFKDYGLRPYLVLIQLSKGASAETIVYATSSENAHLIAEKMFGEIKIVRRISKKDAAPKPTDRASTIQFWANRERKYSALANKPTDDYLTHRMRAQKARVELERLLQTSK